MISEATMNDLPSSVFNRPGSSRSAARGKAVLPPSGLFRGSPVAPRRRFSHVFVVVAVALALGTGVFVGFTVSRGLAEEAQGRGPAGVLKAAVPQAAPPALPRPPAAQPPHPAAPPKTTATHTAKHTVKHTTEHAVKHRAKHPAKKAHHAKKRRHHHHSPCARFDGLRARVCHTIFR
ncbi:hypothetical protein [Nonomuraea sp. NPDC049646]|uniref:hypothetical protein n=2 Tax=unclassified Nonomuraea TaxID=2593643 RepID=UPI00379ABF36